jgi:hypothetical protein
MALNRLRRTLAILLRRSITADSYSPTELWESRRQGTQLPINPKHSDYSAILAETLDVILACDFEMGEAATVLHVTPTQLIKIIGNDKTALTWLNNQRKERDLSPLKT